MAIDVVNFGLLERCQNIMFFCGTSLEVQKVEKLGRDAAKGEPWGQRLGLGWWTFRSRGPQGAAPSTRTRQKKEGERQKERRTKKERVRHVEKGTKGFEHASGQRPGEFRNFMVPNI